MKQISFFLILMCLLSLETFSNSDSCRFKISGIVLDSSSKKPLSFAVITELNTGQSTTSDAKGAYAFENLCSEQVVLKCYYLGYEKISIHLRCSPNQNILLKQSTEELKEVIVSGERKNMEGIKSISLESFDPKTLGERNMQSLATVLSEAEGISFASTGNNVQLPIIHGLYGNRVLILNNGFKHGFQNWGSDHAPEIDMNAAEYINIIKGAAGVRFGPDALAGAILIEADALSLNRSFHGNARSLFESNGNALGTSFKVGAGKEKYSYHFGGKFYKSGDRNAPNYLLTNSGIQEEAFHAGFRYRPNGIVNFKVNYSFVNQDLGILRASVASSGNALSRAINSNEPLFIRDFSYNIKEPNQLVQHHLASFEMDYWLAEDNHINLKIGQQLNKRKEFDVRRNAERPIIDLDLYTNDVQLTWHHPKFLALNGLMGIQYFFQDNTNNPGTFTTPFIPNYNSNRASAFVVETLERGANSFDFGIRYDFEYSIVSGRDQSQAIFNTEYQYSNFTASAGFVRQISSNLSLRSNLGTAWRSPNMAELFSFGQHEFRTQFGLLRFYQNEEGEFKTDKVLDFNENPVAAENSFKWINEFEWFSGKNRMKITAYSHYIKNFIYDKPLGLIGTIRGPMPAFIFAQTDALFLGSDFTFQRKHAYNLESNFGLSYLWSRDIGENQVLINQPPISMNYRLKYEQSNFWKFDKVHFQVHPNYTFRQFQAPEVIAPESFIEGTASINPDAKIFDFKEAPDSYFLIHTSAGAQKGALAINLEVRNILNHSYRDYLNQLRYFADEMGRNFIISIQYQF